MFGFNIKKMILPIVAYGSPILRQVAVEFDQDYQELDQLIENMWETMYNSNGVGLAAPQINKSIRLFLVDTEQVYTDEDADDKDRHILDEGFKGALINAKIIDLLGDKFTRDEGCLSIPRIRENISRHPSVTIQYLDENFDQHQKTFHGLTARVILHEYDHLEGKLFIDHISPLKRTLLKRKLEDISKGRIKVDYRMLFHK